ncbi:hypothetical protein BDR04DRAFT_1158029 [Suillus decipiens]|nr:hypothetical protein BDR04DRAFT_1158029 [Suillus decipiens]
MNSNCQQKEHDFICEEHANKCADAAIVHQCMKEAKEAEICLCEAETRALEMERDMMCLQIEWAKLNGAKDNAKSKGKESVSKCIQLEVQEQVEMLNDDLDSLHSEKKEHDFICEEHANKCADAAIVHQCMKEAKEAEICLCEAETRALEMERDMMCLQIEWAKLNGAKDNGAKDA